MLSRNSANSESIFCKKKKKESETPEVYPWVYSVLYLNKNSSCYILSVAFPALAGDEGYPILVLVMGWGVHCPGPGWGWGYPVLVLAGVQGGCRVGYLVLAQYRSGVGMPCPGPGWGPWSGAQQWVPRPGPAQEVGFGEGQGYPVLVLAGGKTGYPILVLLRRE